MNEKEHRTEIRRARRGLPLGATPPSASSGMIPTADCASFGNSGATVTEWHRIASLGFL